MPIYTYEYTDGPEKGHRIEIKQSMHDEPLTHDPETGDPVRRVITSPIILGQYADHSMNQVVNDNRRLEQLGFTKFEKRSDGTYERTAGREGPRHVDPKQFPDEGF